METKRLIDANAFLKSIEGTDWYTIRYDGTAYQGAPSEEVAWYKATDIYSAIENAPTVDAVEVVHGRWEDMWDGKYANPRYRCSVCKEKANYKSVQDELLSWHDVQVLTPYCPYCGAKMDGGIDNDIKAV